MSAADPVQFDSPDYAIFLGLALVGYWLLRDRRPARRVFIVLASCAFYMAWRPYYIGLILFSTLLDYVAGRQIEAAKSPKLKRFWLFVSLTGNLGLLGTFKYFNFFAEALHDGLALAHVNIPTAQLDVLLPVGISFYTFQTLSYTIDIYRGQLKARKSLLDFAFFVTYFPQLVAGPIVRASEFLPQLKRRPRLNPELVSRGLFLIGTGLVKKVAIADYLSLNLVDRVFDNPSLFTGPEVIVALYGFTMQMYCDFSGYTDMARGSTMLMGLELPENFDRPYATTNPAEFWRRWHMTLSSWLRDYLYFPLGGSRRGEGRAYLNLWLTMFLIGLWHGASWTFVVYGTLQATAMVVHRFFYKRAGRTAETVDARWLRGLKIFACLQFVVFSRILFRSKGLDNAWEVTARIFSGTRSMAQISWGLWLMLGTTFFVHYLPKRYFEHLERTFIRIPPWTQGLALAGVVYLLSLVASSDAVPYIYFQF